MVKCRLFRQQIVLAGIFSCSLCYFIVKSGLWEMFTDRMTDDDESSLEILKLRAPKSIKWQVDQQLVPSEKPTNVNCKNTKQGVHFITDERGYICRRLDVNDKGCCPTTVSARFSCETCHTNTQCCASYENCVSCCLSPDRKNLLENVIKESTGSRLRTLLAVKDQFDLCQIKCRTSSSSVHQENNYKNSVLKYCYGHEPKLPFASR